jgi:hypothetical protein
MGKVQKVKWGLDSEEPEDLQDFLSNDEIEEKNGGRPPKGVYRLAVRRIARTEIKNGDNAGKPRLRVMLVINEPKKAGNSMWNGYVVWDGFNVIQGPSLGFLKRFLRGLGLEWADFTDRTKQDDQDPPHIIQIGKVKFEDGDDPTVRATLYLKPASAKRDAEISIGKYLPVEDEVEEDDEDEEAEDMEDMDEADEEDEDEEDEDDEEDDEEEDDEDDEDEEDEDEDDEDLEEELKALNVAELRERAVDNVAGKKAKAKMTDKVAKMKKAALVALVVEQEVDPI